MLERRAGVQLVLENQHRHAPGPSLALHQRSNRRLFNAEDSAWIKHAFSADHGNNQFGIGWFLCHKANKAIDRKIHMVDGSIRAKQTFGPS